MIYWYKFEAEYWEDEEKKYDKGIVIANNYTEAIKRITNWYGDENIEKVQIACHDYGDCAIITKDQFE